ncbi:MAG: PepSY-like domain-containing protein [Bacteroidales bacterium]|nr:PepSY-like domain-containing protein [Bacteroidales bacterium]
MKITRIIASAAIAAALLAINPAFGQKLKPDAVPDDVKQTMEFEYPNVKLTGWELDGKVYVANFKEDNAPGKCFISENGQWQKTVYPVPKAELPSAITDYIKDNYYYYDISVSQLEESPNVRIHYYIEAKPEGIGDEPSILTFNEVGVLMDRHDPANFDKTAKKVIDPSAQVAQNVSKDDKSKDKNSSANSKSNGNSSSKANASSGKSSTKSGQSSNATNANAAKPSSNQGKTSSSTSSKGSTASSANKGSSTTGKPASKVNASASATATSKAATANKGNSTSSAKANATATNSKPKKDKEAKPVYDERGNKAIDPNTVPAAVKAAFSKKIQRPEELNWFRVDTFYVGNCIAREQRNEVFITPSGKWEKTYMVLPETSVSGNMSKHIQTYYKGYRFKNAIKEVRADKQDVTMVEIYEKANWKQKLVTTFYFDKSGKLLRTVDPNYEMGGQAKESEEDASLERYYEKMNMSNKVEANDNIPKDVMNAFKAKYSHATGVTWEETPDGDYAASYYGTRGKEICIINSYGTITQTMTLGNPDNLLSNISTYVKQNYKGSKIVEYYAVKKLIEKKNFYKVIISNKKTKVEQELWFTTSGKFVE